MNDPLPETLLWTAIGFCCGSLMFSYWIGKWALGTDIRQVGDGNPGMTNVIHAGSKGWAALALVLDALKGAVPVALAKYAVGIEGWWLVPVALAPLLGHAYSPLLRFRGGKAVAATAGVWAAITLWEVPTFGGLLLGLWFSLIAVSGWAVLFMGLSVLAYLLLTNPDPVLLAIWLGNALSVGWKYRVDLRRFPAPRPWLARWLGWS